MTLTWVSASASLWCSPKKRSFNKLKKLEKNIKYIDKPYTRFKGTKFEQNTFFIEDPNERFGTKTFG